MSAGVSRFDCYPSDFLNGIIGLSADEIAAYTVVMMLQYDRGEPVQYAGKERELSVRSGLPRGRLSKAIELLVADGKVSLEDGKLSIGRVVKELKKISERIEKNRENSGKGGEATRKKLDELRNDINDPIGPIGPEPAGQSASPYSPPPPSLPPLKESSHPSDVRRAPARKIASRLSEGWSPSEKGIAYATENYVVGGWLARETEKFRNYWMSKPGKDGAKLDWEATWRNWILSAAERGPPKGVDLAAGFSNTPEHTPPAPDMPSNEAMLAKYSKVTTDAADGSRASDAGELPSDGPRFHQADERDRQAPVLRGQGQHTGMVGLGSVLPTAFRRPAVGDGPRYERPEPQGFHRPGKVA